MIRSLQTRLKPLLPRTRSAYWVYGLALPLFVIGFILVGVGTLETLQDSSPEIADQPLVIETASSVIEEVEYSSGEISAGKQLYQVSCSSCHGADLRGVQGLGKNLLTSEFIAGQTDAELHAFIVKGRAIWDEQNTTGIDMPPRGGNPTLSDEDINHIIAYIRAGH
jgi:mono/diheme cytochrome c family protein